MSPLIPTRSSVRDRRFAFARALSLTALGLMLHAVAISAQTAETVPVQAGSAHTASTPSKRQIREAESAYEAGAKKMERGDLDGAEQEFQHALKLNPENRNYTIAISVVREHRVNELVQLARKAQLAGDGKTADALLAKARSIDPDNQMVIEHSGPFTAQPGLPNAGTGASVKTVIQAPVLASAIHLKPTDLTKDFDLRGSSSQVLHDVALAYGINAIIDDSVEQKTLRFNLQHVTYDQAMATLMEMAHVFTVPVDETSEIIAQDTPGDRDRLERQLQETVYLPGLTTVQINDLAHIVQQVFDVKQVTVQTGLGALTIRAPEHVLGPLNITLQGLIEDSGEVMIEVKLYEISTTHGTNVGATIPQQFTVFNVDQAANQIVNSNQSLVQQAIAQGYITSGTSNLEVALALIDLGLVQSNLATNLIGVFGGGLLRTGVSGSTNATINLSLNTMDSRALDDVQLRVSDHEPAVFREGEKYPIQQSTYSSALSTTVASNSALAKATINGVSVASLLGQFAGGTGGVIPQITYEDLGVTLKTTPVIEKSNRINLMLDLKIEALTGSTLNGNPVLDSRQFSSDLTVGDGESAMLVSNMSQSESAAITGLPGLSELPGFQVPLDATRERDTSQLVVVVTPHIVRRRPSLVAGPRIPIAGALD